MDFGLVSLWFGDIPNKRFCQLKTMIFCSFNRVVLSDQQFYLYHFLLKIILRNQETKLNRQAVQSFLDATIHLWIQHRAVCLLMYKLTWIHSLMHETLVLSLCILFQQYARWIDKRNINYCLKIINPFFRLLTDTE